MEVFLIVLFFLVLLALVPRCIVLVPSGKAAIIERAGKFHSSLPSGLHAIVPFLDRVRVKISVGEQSLVLTEEQCQTADGRLLPAHCTLRWMITDPEKAVFSITDYQLALTTAARLLLHEETAKLPVDQLIADIPAATLPLTAKLRNTALRWGIHLLGIEMVVKTPDER